MIHEVIVSRIICHFLLFIFVLLGNVNEKITTERIRYSGASLPSSQIAIPQSVNTMMSGSTSDSKINRMLLRDIEISEILRTWLLALSFWGIGGNSYF
jgi:hypothetical protein